MLRWRLRHGMCFHVFEAGRSLLEAS
jgi:hypothetical protein